ncbi:TetR/AcrR family transcriptional regulator [Mycobacterium sp. WMMD1722]|uniref:TetR/AcrR family transcriptional regulator n=1 Tax=Mycobacterium sp. WMMD1722 TaxID=3404117 RepID=UPI003BF5763C
MPRQVDHEQRRRQIAEAVWRLAAGQGLEDVSLRKVADEAGVSMRLVQYYFGTRSELLVGALRILNDDAEQVAQQRLRRDGAVTPAELVRQVLMELLPLDEERRLRHTVYAAYFVRLLHDDDLAAAAGASRSETSLAALLQQVIGDATADAAAVRAEAETLEALASGLQAQMLLGELDASRAVELLDRQVRRAFDVITRPPS